jgi:hypothetical protein
MRLMVLTLHVCDLLVKALYGRKVSSFLAKSLASPVLASVAVDTRPLP